MQKNELINWLRGEYQQWQALLDQIGPERMEIEGVAGSWSLKDIIAHLNGWNRHLVDKLQAAQVGKPAPAPAWPSELQSDDAINAWIYATNHERTLADVLNDSDETFQRLFAILESLPAETRLETIQSESGRNFHLIWFGEERFLPGEFFDHLHDDHEPDIQAWLAHTAS